MNDKKKSKYLPISEAWEETFLEIIFALPHFVAIIRCSFDDGV
jgi:hypothetical protein